MYMCNVFCVLMCIYNMYIYSVCKYNCLEVCGVRNAHLCLIIMLLLLLYRNSVLFLYLIPQNEYVYTLIWKARFKFFLSKMCDHQCQVDLNFDFPPADMKSILRHATQWYAVCRYRTAFHTFWGYFPRWAQRNLRKRIQFDRCLHLHASYRCKRVNLVLER